MPQDNEQNQNLTVEEQSRLAELEGLLAVKDEELNKANARITELEQAAAGANERLSRLDGNLAQAISSYKALVVQSHRDVLKELITGDSIEAINSSLASAKELISKVRSGIEAEISSTKVPAGSPQRAAVNLQALSPREKIQYGIGGKK